MELKDLCGEHLFSSVELTCEDAERYGNVQKINILLFTLDGITYAFDIDGIRSEDPENSGANDPDYADNYLCRNMEAVYG